MMASEDKANLREECFVDLLGLLENAGHEGKTADIARKLFEGQDVTCQSFGYHFDRIETQGILEVRYYFPFSRLSGIIDVENNIQEFESWFDAVNGKEVTIDVDSHKKLGDCIVVHRYHYIPEDQREKWLGSKIVATEEQEMLCKLLNRRKPQG